MLIAWCATALAAYTERRLEDQAITWVNAVATATDHDELAILLPQVERWLSRSRFHVRAYLQADAQLAEWEQFYDARRLPPMTASEERAQEPMPPDSAHNVEARRRIRARCVAELARLSQTV